MQVINDPVFGQITLYESGDDVSQLGAYGAVETVAAYSAAEKASALRTAELLQMTPSAAIPAAPPAGGAGTTDAFPWALLGTIAGWLPKISGLISGLPGLLAGGAAAAAALPAVVQQVTSLEGVGAPPAYIPGTQIPLYGPGALEPPAWMTVKTWKTPSGAQFYKLINGQIAVRRRDGTYTIYRPQKHIVISRNPRTGTLIKADKKLGKLVKGLVRVSVSRSNRKFKLVGKRSK